MKNLAWIVGTWKRTGWTHIGPERRSTSVTETVQRKLDARLLVVHGLGKNSEGSVVHERLGIISFDPEKNLYTFATYVKEDHAPSRTQTLRAIIGEVSRDEPEAGIMQERTGADDRT